MDHATFHVPGLPGAAAGGTSDACSCRARDDEHRSKPWMSATPLTQWRLGDVCTCLMKDLNDKLKLLNHEIEK